MGILDTYNRQGYVVVPGVVDRELVREAGNHVDWLMKKNPGVRPERLSMGLIDAFWLRLVGDDRLLDVAEKFIGPNIALFSSQYISKPPHDGMLVPWHQDGSYWPLDPMEVVTLWLAVDDADCENGCMRVIPGTQQMQLQELRENRDERSVFKREMNPSLVDESKAVDIVLKAWDVEVHHPNIIHGSRANTSPRRRCGLTIRYIPTSTRITEANWPASFLLRGHPVSGINDYLPRPKYVAGECFAFRDCEKWAGN